MCTWLACSSARGKLRRHARCSAAHSWLLAACTLVAAISVSIAGSSAVAAAAAPLGTPGYPFGCKPPALPSWPVQPPRVPAIPSDKKPSFIVILADDMGHDDIGLHHPRGPDGVTSIGAQTPNIDKFIQNGLSFSNFYSAPLCAMGRAQVLTGREYIRTGNVFNNYGYEAFSLTEATMGNVMQEAGYVTAHFGKWHNGRALGYEAWERGFNESWNPTDYQHLDNLMRYNGRYVQTKGLMEHVLMDRLLRFLSQREADGKPFLIYYAPYSIHGVSPEFWKDKSDVLEWYFAPEPYVAKVKSLVQRPRDKAQDIEWDLNVKKWASLLYFDDVLGRLFDFIDNTTYVKSTTYTMLTTDNGPDIPSFYSDSARQQRAPSMMIGDKNIYDNYTKSAGNEGSLRTHLAVNGPNVPSGAVTDTLSGLADILPTMAELAGATNTRHLPWTGISFANLLQPDAKPTQQQDERVMFTFTLSVDGTECPEFWKVMTKELPDLGPNREVLKPQPALAYEVDGVPALKTCIVARHRNYKWFGRSDKVFRFTNDSHIERPCNEVPELYRAPFAAWIDGVAKAWWKSVLAEYNSFTKPVFQLGLKSWQASNVQASGAVQLRRGSRMTMGPHVNFTGPGDFVCMKVKVHKAGWYSAAMMYSGGTNGAYLTLNMSVGTYNDIQAGTAPSLSLKFDARSPKFTTLPMGNIYLNASESNATEVCFTLVNIIQKTSKSPVTDPALFRTLFGFYLSNVRFIRINPNFNGNMTTGNSTRNRLAPAGIPKSILRFAEPAKYQYLTLTPEMSKLERQIRAIETAGSRSKMSNYKSALASSSSTSKADLQSLVWLQLQDRYNWPDGQGVFESMYKPCDMRNMSKSLALSVCGCFYKSMSDMVDSVNKIGCFSALTVHAVNHVTHGFVKAAADRQRQLQAELEAAQQRMHELESAVANSQQHQMSSHTAHAAAEAGLNMWSSQNHGMFRSFSTFLTA